MPRDLVSLDPEGAAKAADWANVKSPESYVGYERAESFASPGDAVPDRPHAYTAPPRLALNQWALAGDWTIGAAHGVDVDAQGTGTVTEPRMYQLIRQPEPIADRVFDIEFIGPGVQAFDFTFG